MGISCEMIVADPKEANDILGSKQPTGTWDGFIFKGMSSVILATLWSLIECNTPSNSIKDRLAAIKTISGVNESPSVDIIPPKMLTALASIASLDENDKRILAKSWNNTAELEDWDDSEVSELLDNIGNYADTAALESKTLILWTSL